MPNYVAQRAQNVLNDDPLAINGAAVLMLGVTYKPNIADERESPATPWPTGCSRSARTSVTTINTSSAGVCRA